MRCPFLKYGGAHDALADVAAALRDAQRRRVLDVDDEPDPRRARLGERPVGQRAEDRRPRPAAARLGGHDVAELELALGAVDAERERDAEEPPVAADRRERPRACRSPARPRRGAATRARSPAASDPGRA